MLSLTENVAVTSVGIALPEIFIALAASRTNRVNYLLNLRVAKVTKKWDGDRGRTQCFRVWKGIARKLRGRWMRMGTLAPPPPGLDTGLRERAFHIGGRNILQTNDAR